MALVEILTSIIIYSFHIAQDWGYFGVFIISSMFSLGVLIPLPQGIIIFTLGSVFNPVLLSFVVTSGSMVGTSIKYVMGLGGKELLEKKYGKQLNETKRMFEKVGPFLWIFITALTPIPDDVITIFCGVIRYDFKRYFLATFLGRLLVNLIIAYAGYYSVFWLLEVFGTTI